MRVHLPFPPSVNHYWRRAGARTVISGKGQEFRRQVAWQIKRQLPELRGNPIDYPVEVTVDLFCPDRRKRDLDNFDGKALFDAMTKAGVWLDDSLVRQRLGRIHDYDEDAPDGLCLVSIAPLSWEPGAPICDGSG